MKLKFRRPTAPALRIGDLSPGDTFIIRGGLPAQAVHMKLEPVEGSKNNAVYLGTGLTWQVYDYTDLEKVESTLHVNIGAPNQ